MVEENKPESEENFASMLENSEAGGQKLRPGDKVSGEIIAINNDNAFVNIGEKEDGVIETRDLLDENGNLAVKVGDTIEAYVTRLSSEGARLSRSASGAGTYLLEEAREAQIPAEGRVKATRKGGYDIEIMGKIAFCPGSQMEYVRPEDAESLIGKHMQFLVMRVENRGRNIVVSRRALLERDRKENLEKLLAEIKPGDFVDATITRMANFGAFAQLAPGVEGMIHLSELSWSRVENAEEAVSIGEKVKVKILNIEKDDKGRLKIGLSRKQAIEDPWDNVSERFKEGDVIEGVTRRLTPFGAFVELAPGIEGLAHVSELSWEKRIRHPEDVLQVGAKIPVKIKNIAPGEKKISLSVKDALGDPWLEAKETLKVGATIKGKIESRGQHGLFINVAPGVTGLMPASVIKSSQNAGALAKLNAGDELEAKVNRVDYGARRLTLMPIDGEIKEDEGSWREHATLAEPAQETGILGQALQKAFQNKQRRS